MYKRRASVRGETEVALQEPCVPSQGEPSHFYQDNAPTRPFNQNPRTTQETGYSRSCRAKQGETGRKVPQPAPHQKSPTSTRPVKCLVWMISPVVCGVDCGLASIAATRSAALSMNLWSSGEPRARPSQGRGSPPSSSRLLDRTDPTRVALGTPANSTEVPLISASKPAAPLRFDTRATLEPSSDQPLSPLNRHNFRQRELVVQCRVDWWIARLSTCDTIASEPSRRGAANEGKYALTWTRLLYQNFNSTGCYDFLDRHDSKVAWAALHRAGRAAHRRRRGTV